MNNQNRHVPYYFIDYLRLLKETTRDFKDSIHSHPYDHYQGYEDRMIQRLNDFEKEINHLGYDLAVYFDNPYDDYDESEDE